MRRFKKSSAFIMAFFMGLGLIGCQENPDKPIVQNKDLDKMIENAEDTENGVTDLTDIAENYETYQTEINDEALNVSVKADAKVMIPSVDTLSVYRVRQKSITDELLDNICNELVGDIKLYDMGLSNRRTKKVIEKEIADQTNYINEFEENYSSGDFYSEDDYEVYYQELMNELDRLTEEYENAPEEAVLVPIDGKLHAVAELYNANPQNEYYEWMYSLNKDGEVYEALSDGKDGNYISIYAQNNPNYGNCIKFRKSKYDYVDVYTVLPGGTSLGVWPADKGIPSENSIIREENSYLMIDSSVVKGNILENENATISEEEAQGIADKFLADIGLDSYSLADGGFYSEIPKMSDEAYWGYHNVYIFNYIRAMDGVEVENKVSKHTEGWSGDSYVKLDWPGEEVRIIVNDDGIIGFELSAPLSIDETVVDKSSLKSFDEIKDTFEEMVVISNAVEDMEGVKREIDIKSVTLNYTRISEPDSFDTGLLVPVWNFIGDINDVSTYTYDDGTDSRTEAYTNTYMSDGIVLQINAIDGTVIDPEVGY